MTDRVRTIRVYLDREYRDDDVQEITNAIQMIKGVNYIENEILDGKQHIAEISAKLDIQRQIYNAIDKVFHLYDKR